jgi:hypothetical protein
MDVVVLDTSPLLDDRKLNKPTSRGLLEACERGEIRVIVPSVVVDELVNAAEGSFRNALRHARQAEDILGKHFATRKPASLPDVDHLTREFRRTLESGLRDHGVEIRDVTSTSIQDLIDRDLNHRKPFAESGKGFRDALTWEVLVAVDGEDEVENVTLITSDKSDFTDPDERNRLHPQLRDELVDPDRFRVSSDLGELLRLIGTLREDLAETIESVIYADPHRFAWLALEHVRVPLPEGVDGGEIVNADIVTLELDEVFYRWGAASAVVRAELTYTFNGIVDDWRMEDVMGWPHDIQVDEWMEDSHTFAITGGGGTINVELSVALDPESRAVEIVEGRRRE